MFNFLCAHLKEKKRYSLYHSLSLCVSCSAVDCACSTAVTQQSEPAMARPGLLLFLLSVYNTPYHSSQAALVTSSNHTTRVLEEIEVLIKEKSEPQKLRPARFLDGLVFPDLCANSNP